MTEPTKFRFHPSQNYNIKTQNCVKFKALIICRLRSAETNNIDARKKLTIPAPGLRVGKQTNKHPPVSKM